MKRNRTDFEDPAQEGGWHSSGSRTRATAWPSPAATSQAEARRRRPGCPRPSRVLDGVYNPDRLRVLSPCRAAAGTVAKVTNEEDGDLHVNVSLDRSTGAGSAKRIDYRVPSAPSFSSRAQSATKSRYCESVPYEFGDADLG